MTEAHVVSLELARQLKEAGWKKETEFVYSLDEYAKSLGHNPFHLAKQPECGHYDCFPLQKEHYFAPLATEILDELPKGFESTSTYYDDAYLEITKNDLGYNVRYAEFDTDDRILYTKYNYKDSFAFCDKSLPNALAKMWLYLKKEGLL